MYMTYFLLRLFPLWKIQNKDICAKAHMGLNVINSLFTSHYEGMFLYQNGNRRVM